MHTYINKMRRLIFIRSGVACCAVPGTKHFVSCWVYKAGSDIGPRLLGVAAECDGIGKAVPVEARER